MPQLIVGLMIKYKVNKMPNKCVVCGVDLTNSYSLDFPDRFKVCCDCYYIVCCVLQQNWKDHSSEQNLKHVETCSRCKYRILLYKDTILKLFTLSG